MDHLENEATDSGWQTDENGRRFRMVGSAKEYEMMVSVGGIEVPESQVEEFNARNQAVREANIKAKQEAARKAAPRGRCPFRSGLVQSCSDKCALYTPDGCGLVHKGTTGQIAGKLCPFSPYPCSTDCELYKDGCTTTATKGGN